jgi:hypothetical protein
MDKPIKDPLIATTTITGEPPMFDHTFTTTPDSVLADFRVRDSARRLFERLNPADRDHEIPADAPLLAVYDWEIASDTEIELAAVRTALRLLDGTSIVLGTVNDEHRVIAVVEHAAASAA